MTSECLDVALAFNHEEDWCFQNLRKVIQNLPWMFFPDPPPVAIWIPRLEVFRLEPDNLIEKFATFARVIVGCNDYRRGFAFRPQPTCPKCVHYRLLLASSMAVHQHFSILRVSQAKRRIFVV